MFLDVAFIVLVRYKREKICENRCAGDYLYGKWLLRTTWLSRVMSLMVSYFVLSFSHEMSCMKSGFELSQFLSIS